MVSFWTWAVFYPFAAFATFSLAALLTGAVGFSPGMPMFTVMLIISDAGRHLRGKAIARRDRQAAAEAREALVRGRFKELESAPPRSKAA